MCSTFARCAGSGSDGISRNSCKFSTVNLTCRIFSENTSNFASEPTIEIDSITASAACGAVIVPRFASASAAGSVPMSVEGKSAKLSFIVTNVDVSHRTTNVRKSLIAPAYFS